MVDEEEDPENIILANPSKEFFIDMLTKDISLSECLLDLLDNSVHGLVHNHSLDVMTPLKEGKLPRKSVDNFVTIKYSPSSFTIDDDCGGISIKDARESVFLLGNPNRSKEDAGLGVYGIGMKRAFFKMGNDIFVQSHTKSEQFAVEIDVKEWKKDKKTWQFLFKELKQKRFMDAGTSIKITGLHEIPKKHFASTQFNKLVKDRIATTYALFIKAGLTITVNGSEIEADIPSFATSKDLKFVRHYMKKDGVEILILAGASPVEDRTPRGWYVFCNGRCVLSADKTDKTGWGVEGSPSHHSKYNHFLGYVYMQSEDVRKLPWTTTKEGIERESPIYQTALAQMRLLSRPVLSFFDRMYSVEPVENEAERRVLASAKPTALEKVSGTTSANFSAKVKNKKDDDLVNVSFKKMKKEVEKAKKAIGEPKMTPGQVGEYAFDWFLKRNS